MKIQPLPAANDPELMEAALDAAFAEVCRYQFRPERAAPRLLPLTTAELLAARGEKGGTAAKLAEAAARGMTRREAAVFAGCTYPHAVLEGRRLKLSFKDAREK